jgi:hypothetical protein
MGLTLGDEELITPDPAGVEAFRRGLRLLAATAGIGGSATSLFLILFGVLFWPSTAGLSGSVPIVLGAFMLGVAVWSVWLFREVAARRLTSLRLVGGGLVGVRADGRIIRVDWTDARVAMEATSASSTTSAGVPPYSLQLSRPIRGFAHGISAGGLRQLTEAAKQHGLTVSEATAAYRQFTSTTWLIRAHGHRP